MPPLGETGVVNILLKREKGARIDELAGQYGVSRSTIHRKIKFWKENEQLGRKKKIRRNKVNREGIDKIVNYV